MFFLFKLEIFAMRSVRTTVVLVLLAAVAVKSIQTEDEELECGNTKLYVLTNYLPLGKANAGNYSEYPEIKTLAECVQGCCNQSIECNIAFLFNESCFHIKCVSPELCYPVIQNENAATNATSTRLVIVNHVQLEHETRKLNFPSRAKAFEKDNWKNPNHEDFISSSIPDLRPTNSDWAQYGVEEYAPGVPAIIGQNAQVPEINNFAIKQCEMGLDRYCPLHEICFQVLPKSRQGICNCKFGYTRNEDNDCVPQYSVSNDLLEIPPLPYLQGLEQQMATKFSPTPIQTITVSVASKDVQLPEKEAVLSAYTIPDEQTSGDKYKYTWSLISQPSSSNGSISDQTKDRIMLSNLSEGVYRFKVRVTGERGFGEGEAEANLTVLPEKRTLKPPKVTITPQSQTLKLPNSQAILDGSTDSSDEIISWHWTLSSGPIGYKPELPETNMLQLTDLKVPGNYTFKLTVTDANGGHNSSTARIFVLKGTDYPPEANAIPNVMVRLPHRSIILNGSQSTDDRGIVSWEWIKDMSDISSGAVDMQDTRTPFLKLSNLEEGTYRFILKVTDGIGQSSNTSVMVFVKPPLTSPPTANAGQDQEITLPTNFVLLNGSKSCDNVCGVVTYEWKEISGPSQAEISLINSTLANVTKLTVGEYIFELTVTDEDMSVTKDQVKVTVTQVRNAAPIANAGGDQSVTMPVPVLIMNGSRSSDDLRIVSYSWSRERSSLAAGDVISEPGNPVLSITNIIPGRYVFKLVVTDDQGLTGEDITRVIVHPDPNLMNLVDLTVAIEYETLSQSEMEIILQKISLFLGDNKQVNVRSFKAVAKTQDSTLRFCVEDTITKEVLSGVEIEKEFKRNLVRDAEIFGVEIIDLRTVVCQNNCSGRGRCDEETRKCICQSFWSVDLFKQWQTGESNCDWSLLYVVIAMVIILIFCGLVVWGVKCCICGRGGRKAAYLRKKQTSNNN